MIETAIRESETRENEAWVRQLASGGADQQAALAELRRYLLRGLRRALSSYGPVPGAIRKDSSLEAAFLEDVVQDTLLRILDRLHQFQDRSRFLTWATAIAVRGALSELRRKRWKDVSLEDVVGEGEHLPCAAGREPAPSSRWERRDLVDSMYAVIRRQLTERQRSALLAELRGMPQDEIARHLGSNRNAVYKLTHDARKRLRRGLEAAGYSAADVDAAFSSGGSRPWP